MFYFIVYSLMMAVYFSQNMQLVLNLIRTYVLFDGFCWFYPAIDKEDESPWVNLIFCGSGPF